MENQTKKWAQKKLNTNFHKVIRGSGLVRYVHTHRCTTYAKPNLLIPLIFTNDIELHPGTRTLLINHTLVRKFLMS